MVKLLRIGLDFMKFARRFLVPSRTLPFLPSNPKARSFMRRFLILLFMLASGARTNADQLVLVAGGGADKENSHATKAQLNDPFGVDSDRDGNLWIVEMTGQRLLKVDGKGTLTIAAGTGHKGNTGDGGPGTKATFNDMHSLAVHPDGMVYLADTLNHRIRKYDPKTGLITAFAGTGKKGYAGDGGPAKDAEFNGVYAIAFNKKGDRLYVADLGNRRVRVIYLDTGDIHLVAGNGEKGVPKDRESAKMSPLVDPRAVAVDRHGRVYVLERGGNALRVVGPGGKIKTVLTGLASPKHLCVDADDNVIIADTSNHQIIKYLPNAEGKKAVVLAGTGKKGNSDQGGPALKTPLNDPHGVYVNSAGTLFIVDSSNHRVFRLETKGK